MRKTPKIVLHNSVHNQLPDWDEVDEQLGIAEANALARRMTQCRKFRLQGELL